MIIFENNIYDKNNYDLLVFEKGNYETCVFQNLDLSDSDISGFNFTN